MEAALKVYEDMCFEGDLHLEQNLAGLSHTRELVAASINASPDQVGFTVNASAAASIATSILQRAGVTAVYFSKLQSPYWLELVENRGIEAVPIGDATTAMKPEVLAEAIATHPSDGGKTAVIASHVCYLDGSVLDLQAISEICRANGMLLVINATQSFSAMEIDVACGIDILFASGLKWACAGYGAGLYYVEQKLIDRLHLPTSTGWLSVGDHEPASSPDSQAITPKNLDTGGRALSFAPLHALGAALGLIERIGNGDIREGTRLVQARLRELAAYLVGQLTAAGFEVVGRQATSPASGIVAVRHPHAAALRDQLAQSDIHVSLRTDPRTRRKEILRFGVHYYNTERDLDAALDVLTAVG
jgi:selenocysteine lyase/cysteine desulfurase